MKKSIRSSEPMNQMNQMNFAGADWAVFLQFCNRAAHMVALNAENTIFCTSLGSKSGSLMFIWFIGAVRQSLSIFFNEPNVLECSKGCSMRVFAMSVIGGEKGLILVRKSDGLDELESGQCTSSSLEVHPARKDARILYAKHWWKVCFRRWQVTRAGRRRKLLRKNMRETARTVLAFVKEGRRGE